MNTLAVKMFIVKKLICPSDREHFLDRIIRKRNRCPFIMRDNEFKHIQSIYMVIRKTVPVWAD